MTDETIVKMLRETCQVLSRMEFFEPSKYLLPSYNALLTAARANHPNEPFLSVLPTLEGGEDEEAFNPHTACILFSQLRIALESMSGEATPSAPAPLPARQEPTGV
jgi:hypothetical protein